MAYKNRTDLQNLNQLVAVSLDDIKAFIDQLTDVLDPTYAKKETLPAIASILNISFTKNEDEIFQRKQIKTAIELMKSKGTEECFRVLFYNLGFNVSLVPLWTADIYEDVEIAPPFIKISGLPELSAGSLLVTVVNPDDQYYELTDGYTTQ